MAAAEDSRPFDHKKHAPLKLKCVSCHKDADQADRAGFPAIAQCRTCHTSMEDRQIPSQRIYRLPEFVFFSHAKHAAAKAECATCHGTVTEQSSVTLQQPLKMKWCVDCHKENKAVATCNTCHELGQ